MTAFTSGHGTLVVLRVADAIITIDYELHDKPPVRLRLEPDGDDGLMMFMIAAEEVARLKVTCQGFTPNPPGSFHDLTATPVKCLGVAAIFTPDRELHVISDGDWTWTP